jgi:hypothetical protein
MAFKPGERERIKSSIPIILASEDILSFDKFSGLVDSRKNVYIIKQFFKVLEEELHKINSSSDFNMLKKLVDYINEFVHAVNKDRELNKVGIYRKAKMTMDIIDRKRMWYKNQNPKINIFLAEISNIFNDIKTSALIVNKDQFRFMMKFIHEIRDIKDIKMLIRKYPSFVNLRDKAGDHIISNLAFALINILKRKNSNDRLSDLTYYQSIIELFIANERFEVSEIDCKSVLDRLYVAYEDLEHDTQKLLWLKSLSNTLQLTNNPLTQEEVIKKYDIHIFNQEEENSEFRVNREGRFLIDSSNIITIDGPCTKDFDDAILLEEKDGKYYLYVFIVDIASLVRRDSFFDKVARKKTTSLYLADDYVLPMFPFEISNNLGSLVEDEPRNVICYRFVFDKSGSLDREIDISQARIKVNYRYTYDDVNNIIINGSENPSMHAMLEKMSQLASRLKNKSNRLNLEIYDKLDLGFEFAFNSTAAHRIIEEFMILTNSESTAKLSSLDIPYIYRIHKFEREEELDRVKKLFEQVYQDYNVEAIREIMKILSSTMNNAKYSMVNSGHEALSLNEYGHVTAPVRRYVDLENQRLAYDFLFSEGSLEKLKFYERYFDKLIQE